ncbi:tyrosine-type recombinase/integrase [Wenzhouxiangella marina]|uniref:Uncharacterized protein n=1 Tax=Wenzhouxiangella marina TaxID=1579979 RepID=A0A0K0XTD8_9GAMM|nr:tyrosine-type recombinase/integrase [Wenzhouxiangella marina]AKS40953.1 hypothetical protein WM2015_571 [Wenzhouxiangella marina]MBB6087827.1 site-specific recombinase XerD [Wenzhouxiangella marina]
MGHSELTTINALIVRMRSKLGERELSPRVLKAWLYWARCLLMANTDRAPEDLDSEDIRRFVDQLHRRRPLNPPTRRQLLEACVFLLREVLGSSDEGLPSLLEFGEQDRQPVILSPAEVQALLEQLDGTDWLVASLVYGAGLRLLECLRLRVQDLKPDRIRVCDASGRPSRETVLPDRVRGPIRAHIEALKLQHIRELADGFGGVQLPLGMRAPTSMNKSWSWQFLFPGPYSQDPSRRERMALRGHCLEAEVIEAIERAARQAGIERPVSANTLRNSFAAHLLQRGVAVTDVEKLLGLEPRRAASATRMVDQASSAVA